jgi:tagatose-6-phosphate ketose/aldose isomerase
MVLAGLAFAHYQELERFERIVSALASAWRGLLDAADALAERLAARSFSRVYYLGSGALNGVARESALKLLELTSGRVSSGSESFLGIRHGPLSALDGKGLLVGLVSSDARVRRYELDLLREVQHKKLADEVVVIAERPEPELRQVASSVLELEVAEPVSDDHLAPVMVLFGQLLGLYSSLAQGLKPDTPSPGGVINRVVAGVEMHS